jgi:hypothetical protein
MRGRSRHLNAKHAGATVVLDSRFITGVSDGVAVTTWTSRSGSNNATTFTENTKPLFKARVQGGNPAVQFDGMDDLMFVPSVFSARPFTIISACAFIVMGGRTLSGNQQNVILGGHGGYSDRFYAGNWVWLGTETKTVAQIHSCIGAANSTASYALNGAVRATGVAASWSPSGLIFSRLHDSSAEFSNSNHFALIGAPLDFPAALRRRLEQSIARSFKIACS